MLASLHYRTCVAPRLRATGLPYIASPEIKSSGNAQHIGTATTASFMVHADTTLKDTNYFEAWRHMVCGNTMYIIYVTSRASIRRITLRQRNVEVMELHSTGTLLGHGLVREVRHNQLFWCSLSCIWHDTPGQYIEYTCKHTIIKT